MDITSVNLTLASVSSLSNGILAYANVVFDNDLIIKDIRFVKNSGRYIISMPRREKTDKCPVCFSKNGLSHKFCVNCGLCRNRDSEEIRDTSKVFLDQVHPINTTFRLKIEEAIISKYKEITNEGKSNVS